MKTKIYTILAMMALTLSIMNAHAQVNTQKEFVNFYESLYGTTTDNRGANDALFYTTGTNANDYAVPALTNTGFNVTIATDYTDFNTKLASGNYALGVVFNNGGCCFLGLDLQTTQNFIANGGCMIFCDWELTQSFAALFEASFTGNGNITPMTITDPALAAGITNPVAILNTAWGTWSTALAPAGNGEVLATFPDGSAAIVRGNNAHTMLLGYLSDTPPDADRQKLLENVIKATTCGGYNPSVVPVSNWAIALGIFLIASFAVIRFFKWR